MTVNGGGEPHRPLRAWAVPGVPAVLAASIALWTSARTALWRDEYATAMYASLAPSDSLAATSHLDAVIEPYYLLIHALRPVLGTGTGMRGISIAAFVAMVAVVAVIARRWWGDLAGVIAGVAVAVSTLAVSAAALARPYALSMLLVAVAVLLIDIAVTRPSPWWWAGYAVVAICAIVLQPLASLSIAATGVLAVGRRRRTTLRWVCASLPAGFATIGMLLVGSGQSAQLSWLTSVTVRSAVHNLAIAVGLSPQRQVVFDGILVVLLGAAIAVAIAGLRGAERTPLIFAAVLTFGPPAALFIVSELVAPILSGRYLSFSAIGAALSLAGIVHSARSIKRRPVAIAVGGIGTALLAVSVCLAAVQAVGPPFVREKLPLLASRIGGSAQIGDLLVLTQRYEEGGLVYGFAVTTGDEDLRGEILEGIPNAPRKVLDVREIVSTDPLRTIPYTSGSPASDHPDLWLVAIRPPAPADWQAIDPDAASCLDGLDREHFDLFGDVRLYRTTCPASE